MRRLPVILVSTLLVLSATAACKSPVLPTAVAWDCGPGASASPASSFDLTVGDILVSQAIQTTAPLNSVPLVSGRSTVVRVRVATGGATVAGVTGTLSIDVDGHPLVLAPSTSAPVTGSILARANPAWSNECDTLNFELPAPNVLTPGVAQFQVQVSGPAGETNPGNNTASVKLPVRQRWNPEIQYLPVDFDGLGDPDANLTQQGVGDTFLRAIYPVNDADANLYRQAPMPGLTFADTNGDHKLNVAEGNTLIDDIEKSRQLLVTNNLGPDDRVFLFGWVRGNPIDGNGLGQVGGRAAFGNTDATRFQRTLAHEVGHNFGFEHPTAAEAIADPGWDVGGRLAAGPSGNGIAADGRLKAVGLLDIMHGGLLTNQAWITPQKYTALFNSDVLTVGPQSWELVHDIVHVFGVFNTAGTELPGGVSVFRYPWAQAMPVDQPTTGRYEAIVTNTDGATARVPFEARVSEPANADEPRGAFDVPVRIAGTIRSVQIVDTRTGAVLASNQQTRIVAPSIVLTNPGVGTRLGPTTELSWNYVALRSPALEFQVAYSPDNGATFVPLAVNVRGDTRTLTVNTREIPRSGANTGLIRVFVSDGLNTAYADLDGLTTGAAIY